MKNSLSRTGEDEAAVHGGPAGGVVDAAVGGVGHGHRVGRHKHVAPAVRVPATLRRDDACQVGMMLTTLASTRGTCKKQWLQCTTSHAI